MHTCVWKDTRAALFCPAPDEHTQLHSVVSAGMVSSCATKSQGAPFDRMMMHRTESDEEEEESDEETEESEEEEVESEEESEGAKPKRARQTPATKSAAKKPAATARKTPAASTAAKRRKSKGVGSKQEAVRSCHMCDCHGRKC